MNDTRMYYFEKVYEFLEKEGDLYTLKELYLKSVSYQDLPIFIQLNGSRIN